MNETLLSLCSYLALQGPACNNAVQAAYIQSHLKGYVDITQQQLEREGTALYNTLPLHTPLSAASFFIYEVRAKDYKIPLDKHVNLEYSNYSTYSCNLNWSF